MEIRERGAKRALMPAVVGGLAVLAAAAGHAQQGLPTAPGVLVEQLRQQERERALREQQERRVDERLPRAAPVEARRLRRDESPCFRIDRVQIEGAQADRFPWLLRTLAGPEGDDPPQGRCLGTEGVNLVLARAQSALIARGWVTSRVLAAPQDLGGGSLALTLVPGRIAAIRLAEGSSAHAGAALLASAIPARVGDLLNLRDIEQGLENLKRVPTAEADIRIEPSRAPDAAPGDSELAVKYVQPRRWRVALSADDSGTRATGKAQGGLTLSLDNPLGLNDLAYVNAGHSLTGPHARRGTEAQTAHYSLPWGDWLLGATASDSRYHQTVQGLLQDYRYAGKTVNAELRASRLLWCDPQRKTSASVRGFWRESRNFIGDAEVGVQRRRVAGWDLGLAHKEFFAMPAGTATLEANLAWRRGTGAFRALPAPEEAYGEGTSRMQLATAELALNLPFMLGGQQLRYAGLWRAQWNRTPLTPQDRLAIGGRYSVRGFDGESMLTGERGWFIRNDLGWRLPGPLSTTGAEAYLGVDYGQVGGPSTAQQLGRHLAGAVLGLRGQWHGLGYDLFLGRPLARPEGFRTARTTAGFNLNWSY